MTVEALRAILQSVLPRHAFTSFGIHSGKASWTFPDGIWALDYAVLDGKVGTIVLRDEPRTTNICLSRGGVTSFLAILKAVGAV